MLPRVDPRIRRLIGPAILILLALIPVWRAALLGEGIGPVDHIATMLDPSAPRPETPWNVLQADSILQFRTWRSLVFEGWSQGAIPTWNPYSLLGTPLLANSQSGALYPFHILAGVLRFDVDRAIGLLAWLHLSLAGIGTFRLCRALGTDRASALFGGSAFMLSAFLLAWTPLASVPTTVAWIPWALFWVARRDWRWLAVSLAMMLLGGHLQFAAYGLIGVLVFTLAQGAWRMLPALGLGLALAAAHMLPVLDFGQYSHRRTPPTAEGYAAYSKSALQLWQLAIVPVPQAQGLPNDGVDIGGKNFTGYWPSLVKPGENFAEAAVGLSPAVFLMLFLAPWKRREGWSIGLVAAAGLLLAMPTLFNRLLYFVAPGWAATGSPGRAVVLFVLAGCVLGALGFARFRLSERTPKKVLIGLASGIAFALLLIQTVGKLAPENVIGVPPEAFSGLKDSSAIFAVLLPLAVLLALALLEFAKRRGRDIFALGALIPAAFALGTYATGLIPTGPMPTLPTVPAGTRVAVVNERWNLFDTPRAILPPNLLAAARIVDTGGYDSLIHRDTKALLDAANRAESPPPENGNMMFIKPTVDFDALRALGVDEVWAKVPFEGLPILGAWNGIVRQRLSRGEGSDDGVAVAQNPARSARPSIPKLALTTRGLTASELDGTRLLIRQRALPGWRVSGKEVPVGQWIDVPIPSGSNSLSFTYDPPGLRTGLIVSGISLLVLLSGFAFPLLRGRRAPKA